MSYLNEFQIIFNLFRRLTFRRFINVLLLKLSYFYSTITKKYYHKGFPDSLSIEPTTSCNLKCLECPVGQKNLTRNPGNISIELFDRILEEIGSYIIHLNLYFQGEPFLNKNIFELIKKAHKKNVFITISTNGHFLDERTIEQILDSKLDKLIVSIDGITQETYEAYRKGGRLHKIIAGLELLSEMKKRRESKWPFIEIQFIAFKHNEHEIPLLKSFFSSLHIQKLSIKKAFIENLSDNNQLLPKNQKFSRYNKNDSKTYYLNRKPINKCWRSWHSSVITWDGKILPCCFDKDAKYSFGNVSNESFKSIWKSHQTKSFRSQILSKRGEIAICNNCVEGVRYKA